MRKNQEAAQGSGHAFRKKRKGKGGRPGGTGGQFLASDQRVADNSGVGPSERAEPECRHDRVRPAARPTRGLSQGTESTTDAGGASMPDPYPHASELASEDWLRCE